MADATHFFTATLSTEIPATAPEWVHLLPLGSFKGRDGRGPWVVTDAMAAGRVIAATIAYLGTVKPVIDYDHQTDIAVPKGGTAPAAGWINEFQVRPDGIWAHVEWTARAAAQIAGREFRYLSPVFTYHPITGAVGRIQRAGLTNTPALNLTALASVGASMNEFCKRLCAMLGLPDTADEAAVIEAISKLVNAPAATAQAAAVPDPALYVPRQLYDAATAQLSTVTASLTDGQAASRVEAAISAGKMTPAMRDWGLAVCRANPAAFDEFAAKVPAVFGNLARELVPGRPPGDDINDPAGRLSAEHRAICATLNHDPAAFAKNL